jgi:hypothetical protein
MFSGPNEMTRMNPLQPARSQQMAPKVFIPFFFFFFFYSLSIPALKTTNEAGVEALQTHS